MKKFLLFLLAINLISLSAKCQEFRKIYKANFIEYSNGVWTTEKSSYPDGLVITFNGREVSINNTAEYKFYTYGDVEKRTFDDSYTAGWDAVDKDGRNCYLMMRMFNDSRAMIVTIAYLKERYGFEYITE
jgi:hypothetical protein